MPSLDPDCRCAPEPIYCFRSIELPHHKTFAGLEVSAEALVVEKRDTTGTLRIRRLRKEGKIPAVLYGHGQDNINLSIESRAIAKFVDNGQYFVALSGAVNDTAMIKDVQWDAFGSRILHVDFARVDASETIEVSLPLHMKGDSPGAGLGGMVTLLSHELKISCPANALPEFLEVSIENLQLDGSITASEVALPDGASLVGNPSETLITCPPPKGAETVEADDAPAEAASTGDAAAEEGGDAAE